MQTFVGREESLEADWGNGVEFAGIVALLTSQPGSAPNASEHSLNSEWIESRTRVERDV